MNGREFKQCKILLLNVPIDDEANEGFESIDEAADNLDYSTEDGYIEVLKVRINQKISI